jgi:hypothetical protein
MPVMALAMETLALPAILCSLMLFYNIFQEAKVRSVDMSNTTIVTSAKSRLGVVSFSSTERENTVEMGRFMRYQIKRVCRTLVPFVFPDKFVYFTVVGCSTLLFFLWSNNKDKIPNEQLFLLLLLFLSGPFWLFPMKRLAAFHDYTTMYYWGTSIGFYYLIVRNLRAPKLLFGFSFIIFSLSVIKNYIEDSKSKLSVNALADELCEIRDVIKKEGGTNFYVPEGMEELFTSRRYILGFYYYDFTIGKTQQPGDYIITKKQMDFPLKYSGDSLNLYKVEY